MRGLINDVPSVYFSEQLSLHFARVTIRPAAWSDCSAAQTQWRCSFLLLVSTTTSSRLAVACSWCRCIFDPLDRWGSLEAGREHSRLRPLNPVSSWDTDAGGLCQYPSLNTALIYNLPFPSYYSSLLIQGIGYASNFVNWTWYQKSIQNLIALFNLGTSINELNHSLDDSSIISIPNILYTPMG